MLYEDIKAIAAEADANVQAIAERLVFAGRHPAVNGTMERERRCNLHESAAVARALLTEQAMHQAWRKRAEEAEAKLNA